MSKRKQDNSANSPLNDSDGFGKAYCDRCQFGTSPKGDVDLDGVHHSIQSEHKPWQNALC